MDCVILAAGKGSRLDGITVPFHKPLLVVNGKPLISHVVDQAMQAGGDIIVVTAPENTLHISQVLGNRDVTIIVQRVPSGPGAALELGLKLVKSNEVLVLMADNVLGDGDVEAVIGARGNVVGTMNMPAYMAAALTWCGPNAWYEKKMPEDDRTFIIAWLGPLKLITEEISGVLRRYEKWHATSVETPIGPLFNDLPTLPVTVGVNTIEVGTPEALA